MLKARTYIYSPRESTRLGRLSSSILNLQIQILEVNIFLPPPPHEKSKKVIRWNGTEDSLTELLRKRVEKVLGKCWPKPCHQLRSARRTELDREFPRHVVNEWLGHSSEVAEKHYQQITTEDLAKARNLTTIRTTAGTPEHLSEGQNEHETELVSSIDSGVYVDIVSPVGGNGFIPNQ